MEPMTETMREKEKPRMDGDHDRGKKKEQSNNTKSDQFSQVLTAALEYAKKGRKVFPCDPETKKPLTEHGFKDASSDPQQIKKWWKRFPGAMIGTPTGNGFFVLDIDMPDGPASLKALEDKHGPLPATTLEQRTPSGGLHLFFACKSLVKNSAGKIGPELDIRGTGGYVILPPSVNSEGKAYQWTKKIDMTPTSDWLLDIIIEKTARPEPTPASGTGRPGDGFNQRGDIRPLLENHGWKFFQNAGDFERWTRPGKPTGGSATIFDDGSIYVFTPKAPPFEANKRYSPFAVYAMLDHGDDYSAAAKELSKKGYGEKDSPKNQTTQDTGKKEQKECRIKIIDALDFMAMTFPPRENIMAPWLPSQGLAMIYALRGIGKTHLSLEIAYAVASGGKLFDWNAPNPHGVLFIDGEMPGAVLKERLARIVISSDYEPQAPLRIITPDLQTNGMLDLSRLEDQEEIEPYLEGISLIIIDNISTLCRTGRENEAESWLPVQEWALRQRASGRSVLFIHHSGKGGNQRGTSRREDVLDTVIALRHPGDYSPDQGATFEVHFDKARGIYGEDTKPFEARLTTNESGEQAWITKSLEQSTAEKVANLLNDGVPQKEIGDMLGITKGAVSKAKKRAEVLGLLK